jgi:hypothetical protein
MKVSIVNIFKRSFLTEAYSYIIMRLGIFFTFLYIGLFKRYWKDLFTYGLGFWLYVKISKNYSKNSMVKIF